jgi:hypothetical protein
VTKVRTSPSELANLQREWREWKQDLKTFHLKLEYHITSSMSKKEVALQGTTNASPAIGAPSANVRDKTPHSATTHVSTSNADPHPEDLIRFYVNAQSNVSPSRFVFLKYLSFFF